MCTVINVNSVIQKNKQFYFIILKKPDKEQVLVGVIKITEATHEQTTL
jgi:hypothetical protein